MMCVLLISQSDERRVIDWMNYEPTDACAWPMEDRRCWKLENIGGIYLRPKIVISTKYIVLCIRYFEYIVRGTDPSTFVRCVSPSKLPTMHEEARVLQPRRRTKNPPEFDGGCRCTKLHGTLQLILGTALQEHLRHI